MRKLNSRVSRHNTKNKYNNKCNNNNSNKHKYYNNITKKYMIGGSMHNPNVTKNNISIVGIQEPTLETLIKGKHVTHTIIQYRGIKFQCDLGENKFIIGDTIDGGCINVSYDFIKKYAYLDTFFYSKKKIECIGVSKAINNTNFKNNVNNNTKKPKKINKLLLTLIDIININLQFVCCKVSDMAVIEINEQIISLLYKHIERGYGFYNEFGYLYIPSVKIVDIKNDKNDKIDKIAKIDKYVIYANTCLEYLNTSFTQDKTEFETLYVKDKLSKIYYKLRFSEVYKTSKTLRETITLIIKNLNTDISLSIILIDINKIILEYFKKQEIKINEYKKYYKYDKDKIFTTELNTTYDNKGNNTETKYTLPYKFVLQEHKKPNINITKNTPEENKSDNIIFNITIE